MNLLFKISLVTIILSVSGSIYTQQKKPTITCENTAAKTLYLDTQKMDSKSIEIQFQDKYGKALFSEYVWKPIDFVQNYNIEGLLSGIYFLKIETESKTWVQPIIYKVDGLQTDEELLEEQQKSLPNT